MVRCECGDSAGERCQTDPHGWAVVVEAGQGLEGVAGDGAVVSWEIESWESSVYQSGGPQGGGEHDHEGAVLVGGGLEMLLVGWVGYCWGPEAD